MEATNQWSIKDILPEDQILIEELLHPLGNNGRVTVFPKTEEEIANVLRYANDTGEKVTVMAGGTKRGYGGLTETADILLSLANYQGIVEHTVGDMTVTVKAGTPFKELAAYLAQHSQKISLDPAWPEYATIGGVIAANDSGPKRLGYGSARDVVIGLRMIYPDGTIIRAGGRTVKNVAGYDMNKLFIGAMGTLGVISEVTLKLRPLAKFESLVLLTFPETNSEQVRTFATSLLDSMLEPVSMELLSPSLSERLIGKNGYTLAIAFEDVESSVHYQEEFIKKNQPVHTDLAILQQQDARGFWEQFYKIGPSGAETTVNKETEASLKIGVVNMDVIKVIQESQTLKDSHNLVAEAHGGLGHGLCQVNLKGASEDVVSAIQQLRDSAVQLGGYAVVKHLPFTLRSKVDVWGGKPSHFFLMQGIKEKVDPNGVLNEKRFVGGI
ncbi:FAD-binding oxidoreductase [Peribacillus saganii]|uniref:FAD-binding oxidoreductase n=1 Tax=Peribacillus saganii TaxID=2303992 RepID=A0A372LSJ4_9BACI|nr:FAD-binding oxidoreductase [Peribacillus saganii]RFU71185.1 FAD-binding oxidoreductase [Peribacillus saganii]